MAKKKENETPAKPETPAMTPLEQAKLAQFKKMFPRECNLLIAEYEASKGTCS